MKTQKVDTVPQREDARFLVQLQPQAIYPFPDFSKELLRRFLRLDDDIKIVHVSPVGFTALFLFYPVVELVQEQEGEKLARLVAQRQAVRCVDVDTEQVVQLHIQAPPDKQPFQRPL